MKIVSKTKQPKPKVINYLYASIDPRILMSVLSIYAMTYRASIITIVNSYTMLYAIYIF